MRAGDRGRLVLLARQLVQPHGQALGPAAAVHEDDRGAVLLHQPEQLGVDRRPDRALRDGRLQGAEPGAHQIAASRRRALTAHRGIGHVVGVRLAHVLHRHVDLHVERLADARVHHRALAAGTHEEAADLLQRTLSGGEPDALDRALGLVLQALERQRQMGPALGAGHGVDLVHDHGLRAGEELARPGGEHQVERLRGRDEHVGRSAQHRLALALRGVAGANAHRHVAADPPERGAQVLLHVVGEGLQRRDVDQPRASFALWRRLSHQTVEGPEEGGECLARAGGGGEQDVLTGGDGRPGLLLSRGGTGERPVEPVTDLRCERCERIGGHATYECTATVSRPRWPLGLEPGGMPHGVPAA